MRVIYNTCFADPWLKIAAELREKHGFEPVYWIGFEVDDSARSVPAAFPGIIYHPIFDAWKGIFPDEIGRRYGQSHIGIDFIREYAGFELQALKMMDRMDPDRHGFSFSERQRHYRNFIRNWTACVDWLQPDLVISPAVPHRVYDYALYFVCRCRRIPFIMFHHTAFPGRIIPLEGIDSIGDEIRNEYEKRLGGEAGSGSSRGGLAPDILERYRAVQADYERGKPAMASKNDAQHDRSSSVLKLAGKFLLDVRRRPERYFGSRGYLLRGFPTYLKQRNRAIEASRFGIVRYAANKLKANRYRKGLKAYYEAHSEMPDLHSPYIYLPLHYQPEMTTSPAGDIFVDQFLCVETLARNIPPDWQVYVKEHPVQFHAHGEGHTSRNREFYDDLLRLPNVRLVSLDADSFALIENALAVATVTGTVGWEAMARRKPVLVFGLSWYEGYPGVLKIASEEAAKKITGFIREFSFTERKLLAYLAALEKYSLRSYCLTGPKPVDDQPEEEAIGNMVRFIRSRAGDS